MKITLKDGSVKEYAEKMSVLQIATDISEGLGRAACAGKVNGVVVDLRDEVSEDCELEILTFRDEEGKKAYCTASGLHHMPCLRTNYLSTSILILNSS